MYNIKEGSNDFLFFFGMLHGSFRKLNEKFILINEIDYC